MAQSPDNRIFVTDMYNLSDNSRGVVYILEMLDRRVRSRADLESRLAVPSLGMLSRWQPMRGALLPAPMRAARALPQPW